jgi:hypothetical protein
VTDLERHIPMAERLDNDPGDAGRMARSFLAAMARLAEVEAEHEMTRRELQRYQSHVHDADGFTAQAAQRALDATARAEAAEAKLAAVEAEMNAYANAYAEANKRLAAAEAEIEFMRAWCADHFGGLMPPTREQNAALMRALDEMETDRG